LKLGKTGKGGVDGHLQQLAGARYRAPHQSPAALTLGNHRGQVVADAGHLGLNSLRGLDEVAQILGILGPPIRS